ncbi:ABC transporter permease [Dietzia sp. 179-F 9C3 NHS]|uniref:ABC transporter permease n=1 Tax=Dietzia sp. 179-F 9C3 NHS TaxID=3374295 RepID=UPI003879722D
MNPRTYLATTRRIGLQLLADRRTVALILLVPTILLTLLYFLYKDVPVPAGQTRMFDRIAVNMLGVLPMLVMFLVTSVAMLRERSTGTLERLMTTPLRRGDLVAGYTTAFAVAAVVQSLILSAVTFWLLGVQVEGSVALVVLVAALDSIVGVSMGLLASAFARTEFQAVQFMPIVIGPQIFLCGLLLPREEMADWLYALSALMPMSYAVDALAEVRQHADLTASYGTAAAILLGFGLLAVALASATLRRRSG